MAGTSVNIPKIVYRPNTITVESTDNQIVFDEGGVDLTATVAAGTYNIGQLCYAVKQALQSAGDNFYSVRYSYSTNYFTIKSDGPTFGLNVAASANDLLPILGFTTDRSGALTYTSNSAVPATVTHTFTERIRNPQIRRESDREDLILENGRQESSWFGASEIYSLSIDYETRAVAQSFYDFVVAAAEFGVLINFYPDKDVNEYIQGRFVESSFDFREMATEGLYGFYSLAFSLRIDPDNAGTISIRDLVDRGPY